MSELDQILEYEEKKKEEIANAQREAEEAISRKREQLREKLSSDSALTVGEAQDIAKKTQARIEDLRKIYQEQQEEELAALSVKKSDKFERVVNLAVINFQDFNV